ncbi:MAG: DNA polymerase IV [Myxococcota bacterium]
MNTAPRQILHVDMDAFFAAVEQRDDAALRGRPVLVGGPSKRGVVAAASYEARALGIHSAMPMAWALKRCPQAIVIPGRHGHYQEVSRQVFTIFRRFTPLVEGLSLDEAFLDVTASQRLFGPAVNIAQQIKQAIKQELCLIASAGLAPGKFAAKIASDLHKPDGLVVVPENVAAFLAPLPVEKMWGVGPVAAQRMRQAGFATLGDLARSQPNDLEALLGSWGAHVHRLANGFDERPVRNARSPKSIGAEHTFAVDIRDVAQLERALLQQASQVAARLFATGLYAKTVTLKIKFADFKLRSMQRQLPQPAADTDTLFHTAKDLLRQLQTYGRPIRLTGISACQLTPGPIQRHLLEGAKHRHQERLEGVSAQVRARFGSNSLIRATLLDTPE